MTKYREILRLKSLGFSERNIAQSCGVSRNTVAKVLKKAAEINLSWPLDFDMTDSALEELMFPKDKSATNKRMPNFNYIRKELLRNGVSYTSIWNVEKVLYAINDVNLPFPVTFTQITWFVLTEFIIILFADVPPLSMIEGAFLKYFGIPVALTWFMSQKTFDGKKPYSYIKTMVLYALRPKVTYAGKTVNLHKQKFEETITAVRSVTYVPD